MKVYSIVEKYDKTRAETILAVDMPKLNVVVRTSNQIVLIAPRSMYEAWSNIITDNVKSLPSIVCSWNAGNNTLTIECNSNNHILELRDVIDGIVLYLTRVIRKITGHEVIDRNGIGSQKETVLRTSSKPMDIIDRKGE